MVHNKIVTNRFQPKRSNSMADHDGIDLQSEVNRILGALKLEEIRKHGIKKLPKEQYDKAKVGFQNDAQQNPLIMYQPINEPG